jgi:NAD(P)-dependent dehydrogenase (short-subunit alcohol dehydrogenase family)
MTNNPFNLVDKTILVTGASSGIGKAVAILCASMGAHVIITGRAENRLKETFALLNGDRHQMVVADLTQPESRDYLCTAVPELDGIVHCAGIGHRKLCKAITAEDIAKVMDANFNASVLLQSNLLSQKKINRSASIVFLSSRTASVPTIANSLYSASKGALKSYAQCLALELAPRGIRVNCISPAMVWTPLILQEGVTKEDLIAEQAKYPLKRYGTPEDIANLAVFLLSDAASWMTGSCIDITGGSIEV